jgi:hypothetical protein
MHIELDDNIKKIFQDIRNCTVLLNCEGFIYGTVLWQYFLKTQEYNPQKLISVILNIKKPNNVSDLLQDIFQEIIAEDSNVVYYNDKIFKVHIAFIENFDPYKSDLNPFTISQIYFDIKNENIIDVSGTGIKHLTSTPIIIKSTIDYKKWQWEDFIFNIGTFQNSIIDEEDEIKLSKLSDLKFYGLDFLFFLNRPGTAIKELIKIFPMAKNSLFGQILSKCKLFNILISENINIKKVFSDEKLKLLDLYGNYFRSSSVSINERFKTLIRLLVD